MAIILSCGWAAIILALMWTLLVITISAPASRAWVSAGAVWAYSVIALRWAAKYYAAERELALELMKDIDDADAVLQTAAKGVAGMPRSMPGLWREVEREVQGRHDV